MMQTVKQGFNNLKVKYKFLVLLLLTIILPFSVLGVFSYLTILNYSYNEESYNFKNTVSQVSINLNNILYNLRINAESIYGDPILQKVLEGKPVLSIDSIEQKNEIIDQKITLNTNAATILFAATGQIYDYNMYFYPDYTTDYRQTDEYKECKANDYKLIWIPTDHVSLKASFEGEYSQKTLGVALIIKDLYTRDEVGMVEILLREDYLFNLYDGVKMTPNTFAFILDSNGNIISHANKSLLGKKIALYTGLENKIKNNTRGNLLYSFGGKPYILMYDTIDANGWKLVYAIPKNELLEYTDSTKYLFIILITTCLVILALISFFISKGVSKPIEKIVSVIDKYGKGELSARVKGYDGRKDEVGILSKALNNMAERIAGLINNNYRIKIKMKEVELETLQAQINPHFLYNTLDTISFLARKHNIEEISGIAIALGDLMRISIKKDRNMIPVGDEINHVKNYMIIQQTRFRDKVSLVLDIPEEINDIVIPKLILQPLVENAIVHGLEEKMGKGKVTITGRLQGDDLIFTVMDDGIGLDEKAVNEMLSDNLREYELIKSNGFPADAADDEKFASRRIGLKNVDMRIKLCYGGDYGLTVHSRVENDTTITIRCPGKIADFHNDVRFSN